MKIKSVKYIVLASVCALNVAACDNDKNESDQILPDRLELLAVSPGAGEKLQPGMVEIVMEFNQPVVIADTAGITFSGGKVENPYTVARYLKAKVTVPQNGNCTFSIAPAALSVFGRDMASTEEYSLVLSALSGSSSRSPEAACLMEFMHENTGRKMISGVSACINWNQSEAMWVYRHTGRYPALNNYDFIHDVFSSPGGWIDYSDPLPVTSWADENGVVGAMWHWQQLANNGYDVSCTPGSEPGQTSFRPSDIFNPESDGYKKMIADIDRVAVWMKPLAEQRIPVLWRPLHEAQGNWKEETNGAGWQKSWFWWGIDGPEACVEIWKVMYDRMVYHHGLTNLIWVYNSGDSMRWYPGDEYVDVVGYDFYNSSMADMEYWYNYMKEHYPGKLIAICECGNIPKLSEQWARGLYWNYFMPWWDNSITGDTSSAEFNRTNHNNADIDFWNDAWNCDFMLSRDQMPSFRN
ncbi:MAG: glycoside hydrolase family 26 protein [Muribaculaceae bacterium]|nr:glycoside hydrolase family 26 protein [Muribaculaceae bacterium]